MKAQLVTEDKGWGKKGGKGIENCIFIIIRSVMLFLYHNSDKRLYNVTIIIIAENDLVLWRN